MGTLLLLATMILQMKMIFQSGRNGINCKHKKEMCHLHSSFSAVKDEWDGYLVMTVETNVSYKILVNQCLGKWPFRRHIIYGKKY